MIDTSQDYCRPLVLTAEDDLATRLLLKEALEQADFAVVEAEDGNAALESARRLRPDVILLDALMPGRDGFTVCGELRRRAETENLPVLMVTALDDDASIRRAYEAGATDFVTKPINWTNLGFHIRYLLRSNRALMAVRESEEKYRRLAETLNAMVYRADPETLSTTYVNGTAQRLFGYSLRDWLRDPDLWSQAILPEDRDRVVAAIAAARRSREDLVLEYRIFRADGAERWVEDRLSWELSAAGEPLSLNGIVLDITEQKRLQEQLQLAREVFENSEELIAVTDPEANIVDVNPAFTRMTGYGREEIIGRNMRLLRFECHDHRFYEHHAQTLLEAGRWQGELRGRRKDGRAFSSLMTINAVKNAAGKPTHFISISTDTTELKAVEERLRRLAFFDSLTGLPNRDLLNDRLQQAVYEADRDGFLVAVLWLDLDNFKDINDTLGHPAGDRFLTQVAHRLGNRTRHSDTVARMGGDAFVLVLRNPASVESVSRVAEETLEELTRPYSLEGQEIFLTASSGAALFPVDGRDPNDLLKKAETAMYHAKRQGKNRHQFFSTEMNVLTRERLALKSELRRALQRQELVVHYQPKIDLATGEMIGMEALVRWQHPDRGLISPATFIPLAEETGQIDALGERVLRLAAGQVVSWRQGNLPSLTVAVNLSPIQVRNNNLLVTVEQILADTQLAPHLLELEITESAIMQNTDQAVRLLEAIRDAGIGVTMDDFGTGYSSLSYLKRFPIGSLKIDRSFVNDLLADPEDAEIVRAIIAMAHRLRLKVVAEGVETFEQLAFLRREGCDQAQGYLFARPLPASEFAAWVRQWPARRRGLGWPGQGG